MTAVAAPSTFEANRKWWVLAAVTASLFMVMVDTTIVNVALPAIQSDLEVDFAQLEWTVNAFLVVYAGLLLTGGRLADVFGRRRMFLTGLALFTLASLGCGLAPSVDVLIAARAVQGAGAALMLPATHALIASNFSDEERGMAYGIWAGVSMSGLSLGPIVGGVLVQNLSWRWIFYVNVPFGLAAGIFAAFVIREAKTKGGQRLDLAGLVTASAALFTLVFGLTEGNRYGWTSPTIVAVLTIAVVALVLFVLVELRQDDPLLDLSLFRNSTFSGANTGAFVVMLGMLSFLFFCSLYFQIVLGYSAVKAGAMFLPTTLVMMLVAPLAGKLTDKIGPRFPIAGGLVLFGVALVLISRLDASSGFWDMLPRLVLAGIGIGLVTAPTTTTAIAALPVRKAGVASGVVNTFRQTGAALGIAIMGAILASHIGGLSPASSGYTSKFVSGFQEAILLAGCIVLAGAAATAVLIRRPRDVPELPEAPQPRTAIRSVATATLHAFAPPTAVHSIAAEEWARAQRDAAPALVATSGPLAGRRFPVVGDLSIGRRGTVKLDDDEASRYHALVRCSDGSVEVVDLGSTNGTFVNGRRITGTTGLADGDVVKVGATTFELEVRTATEPLTLVIEGGPLRGRRFPVSNALSLGRERGAVDILIDDEEVSRHHAIVHPVNGACEIADAGSMNGTFVNDARLEAPTRLAGGDVIRLGHTTLRVEEPGGRAQAATKVGAEKAGHETQAASPALVVQNGPLAGRRLEVSSERSLGRQDTDIEIDDVEVSRRHAHVRPVGDNLEIVDAGSANGTFVNGRRIAGRTRLANGDLVQVGQTSFVVDAPGAPPPGHAQTVVRVRNQPGSS